MEAKAVAFGVGTLLISLLLPYIVKTIPGPLEWGGMSFGALLAIWGMTQGQLSVSAGPAVLFSLGIGCLVGAAVWHFGSLTPQVSLTAEQERRNEQTLVAIGGNGGGAKVFGSGVAFGGPGGSVALGALGRGGEGGSAEVYGNGIAAGGAGGSVGSDKYWPHPAKNGYDAMMTAKGVSVPVSDRTPGRGGAVGGYEEKLAVVNGLRAKYFSETHTPPRNYLEDIRAVPLDYLNGALATSGMPWRAKIVDLNEYDFYIP